MNKKSDFIDLRGTLITYLRNWYWFALSVIICLGAAYVYVKTHPRKVMVRANIIVTQDEATVSMMSGLGGLLGADPYVQDEIFVITSHSILTEVTKNLGTNKTHLVKTGFLTKKVSYPAYPVDVFSAKAGTIDTLSTAIEFDVDVKSSGHADITVKANGKTLAEQNDAQLPATIETTYGNYIVNTTDTYTPDTDVHSWVTVTGFDAAAEDLAETVVAEIASKKSNVIELSMEVENAAMGIDILNNIMAVYNQRGIEERNTRAVKTARFIDQRLDLITKELNATEANIQDYKETRGIVDVATEAAANAQLKTEIERNIFQTYTEQEIIKTTLAFLADKENDFEMLPAGLSLENINSAIATYNGLIQRRSTLLTNAKAGNRTVDELEQQITAMRQTIVGTLERALQNNKILLRDLEAKSAAAQGRLGNIPTQEREYLNLRRQQEIKQEIYLYLMKRREETAMVLANAIPKGTIVDHAYALKDPLGMGKFTIALIALLIGLIIPPVIIYIRHLLHTKFDTRDELERQTTAPIMGEMCMDRSGDAIVVSTNSTSSSAELFRLMRTNLQFVLNRPDDKVVLITSSRSGEGKTFISANLAASLSLLGKHTVLVGFDIRNPQLANYLGIPASPGVTQFLADRTAEIDSIIQHIDGYPNFDVAVAGPVPPNPGELLTSDRVDKLVNELRQRYDYVILDTAPVGMVSDTFHLVRHCDASIYVMRAKYTTLRDVRFFNSLVETDRLRRVNIVVNGTASHKGYGYGYHKKKE